METIKNISLGIFHGCWDSIRGMTMVLHIDAEIHKLNAEKEALREQRLLERQRRMRRTPSPVPSSASAMAREEREQLLEEQKMSGNPDERSLESIRRKPKPPEEQKPQGEKKVAKQVLKCCLLNGGFTWASIVLFEQLLLPVLKFVLTLCYGEQSTELHMVWGWLQSILSIIFGMMWVLPIFLLSKIVSSLWFTDIANAAYRVRKGRPQMIPSISKLVADFLFSLVVQALFLVQSMLVNMLPVRYLGEGLCFLHLCLLYSLYAFEYKWFNMGWELHRRLNYIEHNWPYFIGFGIPLTVLTNMTSSVIVSSCIFSIFFPLFILSGNEAKPLIGTTDTPLRLFSPVIFVSNLFFKRSAGRTQKITASTTAHQLQQQQQQQLLKQQQQQLLKQQQQARTHQRHQREQREHSQEAEVRKHRYQQPPTQINPQLQPQRSLSRASPQRSTPECDASGRYIGGMPPLIPIQVPGAPQPPRATGTTSPETPTVRHR